MENRKIPEIRFPGHHEAWEQRKLGAVVDNFEYGINASATMYDGENKYIRITDINDSNRKFNQSSLTSPDADLTCLDNFLLKDGDILFARTGASVGKTYLYRDLDGKVYYAGFLIRARIQPVYDSEFIYQNTLSEKYKKFVKITSQRSGQPGINATEYANYELSIPSLKEQQSISALLKFVDANVDLLQHQLTILKQTKQGFLQKMFPKEGESVPEIRFSGFDGEWAIQRLGDLGHTFTGLSGKTKEDFGKGNAEFITYVNVFKNAIADLAETENVEVDYKQNEVEKGDILFTTSSETPHEVGMSSLWLGDRKNVYLNSFCFGYRPTKNLSSLFLAYLLRSQPVRNQMILLAQGISRYNISKTKAMDIKISFPTAEEQIQIGNFFKQLDDAITLKEQELKALQQTKKAFLQKMFV